LINTVLGTISEEKLGKTLMHEHIIVNMLGRNLREKTYTTEEVVNFILPYLKDVKSKGCSTIVEPTPEGVGRDLEILKQCSAKSGINLITCTGAWDGGASKGICVPVGPIEKSIDEIASIWIGEFQEGIEGTNIKPGFIKMALGDEGKVFPLQEKLLRAAIKTSKKTGMRIHCHVFQKPSVKRTVEILEEENLPFDNFIWVHADACYNIPMMIEYAKRGMWIQFDGIAYAKDFERYPPAIKKLQEEKLLSKVLFGQDSGYFAVKENKDENTNQNIKPYAMFFDDFIPFMEKNGIEVQLIDKIITDNSRRALTLIKD